jgi:hypothetical protein
MPLKLISFNLKKHIDISFYLFVTCDFKNPISENKFIN